MNFIPLNLVPQPGEDLSQDKLRLINFSLVYDVAKLTWWPIAGKPKEGSTIYITGVDNGRCTVPYSVHVQETRMEILRLLEGPGKHSCQCKQPKPEKSHD